MSEPIELETPSADELAALDLRVTELLRDMAAVPVSERVRLDSGKFAGPVAETVIGGSGPRTY